MESGHAMLLVGVRYDREQSKVWCSMQNWWEGKQFLEMNLGYLRQSLGVIYSCQKSEKSMEESSQSREIDDNLFMTIACDARHAIASPKVNMDCGLSVWF